MKKILIINGPNLNLLGIRKPEIYGKSSLKKLMKELAVFAKAKGYKLEHFQTNHEGEIIDKLHSTIKKQKYIGCIINAGAYTHYSYAIRDAIESIPLDCIEVHLTDIENRENFRKHSVLKEVCLEQIKGLGIDGYKKAIEIIIDRNNNG